MYVLHTIVNLKSLYKIQLTIKYQSINNLLLLFNIKILNEPQ